MEDQWICVSPGRISEHVVSIAPLLKRVPIRSLSNAEQCGLQKHLRRSYTKPLEVDTFQWPFFGGDSGTGIKEEGKTRAELPEKQEQGMVSMEQDSEVNSDSGKGTAVSAASPVQEVRRMKRKSKSFSPPELEQTETEDSGIQKETANKHLKLVNSSFSNRGKEGEAAEKTDGVVEKKQKKAIKKQKNSSSSNNSNNAISKKLGLKIQKEKKLKMPKHKHQLAKNKPTGLVSVQKSQYLKINMIKEKKDMKHQVKKGDQLRKSVSSTKKDKC